MTTFEFVQLWVTAHSGIILLKGKVSTLLLLKSTQFLFTSKLGEESAVKYLCVLSVPRGCCLENSCSVWGSWKAWGKCCDCYVRQGPVQQQVSKHGPLAAEVPHTCEGRSQCVPAAGRKEDAGESWEGWSLTSVLVQVLLFCVEPPRLNIDYHRLKGKHVF